MGGWGIVHMVPGMGMRLFFMYFLYSFDFESYKYITYLEIINNEIKKSAKTPTNNRVNHWFHLYADYII